MFDELKKKIDIENELKENQEEEKVVVKQEEQQELEFNTTAIFTRE
jgi:hypothetical protein